MEKHISDPPKSEPGKPAVPPAPGFALVVTLTLLAMIALVGLGVLSLSTVVVREASASDYQSEARANARLALMVAIGELQIQLGPDQRVSARAEILEGETEGPNRHWTVVWSSRMPDGAAVWERDEKTGLKDRRVEAEYDRAESVLSYLVSGNEGGRKIRGDNLLGPASFLSEEDAIRIVAAGSSGPQEDGGHVLVPKVAVTNGDREGHYAYWVGDLGVRANVATPNPFSERPFEPGLASRGGYNQILASQRVDSSVIGTDELVIPESSKPGVVTQNQVGLAGEAGPAMALPWTRRHFHDVTAQSAGVLANVRAGGLKRDLTAYFESDGTIPDRVVGEDEVLPGLSDKDLLVGPANPGRAAADGVEWEKFRHRNTAPRFGVLRDWARLQDDVRFAGTTVDARLPKLEPEPRIVRVDRDAATNLKPVSIADYDKTNLIPVLVEGSMYSVFSYHDNPPDWQKKFNIRFHTFPRVVLWNPFNTEITLDPSIILLHLNGRRDFRTDGQVTTNTSSFYYPRIQWLSWFGGRSRQIQNGQRITESQMYNDPYVGSFHFSLPETTFGPGECLVFSPARAAEYDRGALEQNLLSCEVPPDQSRNFYFSSAEYDEDDSGGGFNFEPGKYWYHPYSGTKGGTYKVFNNQADDARMVMKSRKGVSSIQVEDFDELPQLAFVSVSHQFGAGRQPFEAWDEQSFIAMEKTALKDPVLRNRPDRRTREGYRLRWFMEHPSNTEIRRDPLRGSGYQESALMANWNLRASYATRSPWENIGGDPGDGVASGPWYFGAFTRDLYDDAVGWDNVAPVLHDGRYHGNPFGQPVEGQRRYVLFDVPRKETGVLSLGQLQHAKLSEFIWHPSFVIGQSLADPRLGDIDASGATHGTSPPMTSQAERDLGGFTAETIGWSQDTERSLDRDEWARFARAIYQNYPESDLLAYDLSFEVNHTLWDDFFLSTGDEVQKRAFLRDFSVSPLPNGRHLPAPETFGLATPERLSDFHQAAYHLMVDGAFNVNSTSVEAWKAVLSSTRNLGFAADGRAAFPRVLDPEGGEFGPDGSPMDDDAWSGFRSLDDDEVTRLAEEIVGQVKLRGPFLSLSDFVNRRLAAGETGRMGPLQAAIEAAGLNEAFNLNAPYLDLRIDNDESLKDYTHPDNIADATRMEQKLKPDSKAWGAPTYLTQGDVLQVLGPMLSARSDSFVIRCYGDALDRGGKLRARAWCEAVVQRIPQPVAPDKSGLNPRETGMGGDFGRRFVVRSFRWLNPEEV